jgi:hypothetical protein
MPVDGVVLEGTAIIDASALTGEARPVERGAGDRVASGTVNVGAAFRMCAVARASESTYTGIVRLVEAAQQSKAPAARLHDSCLVDQDVPLFLDVFPPLTAPRQRCQAGATRAIDGCYWTLDASAGAARVPKRLQPVLSFRAGGCVWPPSSLVSWHTRGVRCGGKYACSRARERATGRTATSPFRRAATACWRDQVSIPQWRSMVTRAPSSEHG